MKAVLIGATGLVGSYCLKRLLSDQRTRAVAVYARRDPGIRHEKLTWNVVDMAAPRPFSADEFYCCLGTTIREAGSREAFRRVDLEIPLAWARAARAGGTGRAALVSSVGADIGSSAFYLSTKGEVERAFSDLRFPYAGLFRPSMLLGARGQSRPGESAGRFFSRLFSPLLSGSLRKYRPIAAETVAAAMVRATRGPDAGICVYHYDEMRVAAGSA